MVFSVIGDDWRGEILKKEMSKRDINIEQILVSPQRTTTTYVKPILTGFNSRQEDARIDFENTTLLSSPMEERLLDLVTQQLSGLDALIIIDQLDMNGIITERVRESLNNLAVGCSKPITVDSRQHIGFFRNITLKPNGLEALASIYQDYDPHYLNRGELIAAGIKLSRQSDHPVFITLGEEGVLICDMGDHRYLPAAPVKPPLDPVGAGDTFLAAMTVALASGATPWEAGAFANLAAAVTVEKLNQTGTASPQEIFERFGIAQAKGI
jgi:rfaE bifunctional protein kinase chain/domain